MQGPDHPTSADQAGLPPWPKGWHDMLQYHLFFPEGFFVHCRVFLTPSLEHSVVWTCDAKGEVKEVFKQNVALIPGKDDFMVLDAADLHIHDGPQGGQISVPSAKLEINFESERDFKWLPGGQSVDDNAVIHRPQLKVKMKLNGVETSGEGYSKRYFGEYGPHWGYRFIQSSGLAPPFSALWTADATFGFSKYNYFKLLKRDGELIQAKAEDTYQQDCDGYAYIDQQKYHAHIDVIGEWVHDYVSAGNATNSRMQLRYCKLTLCLPSGEMVSGYALNERCFGTLG
jgi:hypothetical protein